MKADKGNWLVTMECVVKKLVYCSDCTRAEAEDSPWEFSTNELELEMSDWEIIKVERDE
jgi:hypothetical protein